MKFTLKDKFSDIAFPTSYDTFFFPLKMPFKITLRLHTGWQIVT